MPENLDNNVDSRDIEVEDILDESDAGEGDEDNDEVPEVQEEDEVDDGRNDEDESYSQDAHGCDDLGLHDDNGLDGQRHGGLEHAVVNQYMVICTNNIHT